MMYKIELTEQTAQPILSIRTKTNIQALPQVIGESYQKIMAYLTGLGEMPAGTPFTAYYNMDMENLDVEMGFPVTKPLPGKDAIEAGVIPPGKIAACMYKGAYSGMEQTYNELFKWIADNGYEQTGVYYEYYFNSPAEVTEEELLTRIVIPVKGL